MSLAVSTWSGVSRKTMWLWLPFTSVANQIFKFSNSWNHWIFREISSIGQLNVIRNSGVLRGLVRTPEKCEGWSCYQNSTGADSPKSTLETDHVPRAEHIDSIKLCLIKDDLHMRGHHCSRDTLHLLWRRSDGQEQSIPSSGTLRMGTKTFSSRMRNFSPSRSSITTRTTRFMLKRPLRCVLRV